MTIASTCQSGSRYFKRNIEKGLGARKMKGQESC
jgi:hypothetical protein